MTFFNKKTEVMNIELTPYGRYLYSIGKLRPQYYEFVDDDILYRASGSTEKQEESHTRIMKETPKFKPPTSFQKEKFEDKSIQISQKRTILNYMDQKQNSLFALGKSSYSSDMLPNFQITMLQGHLSGSEMTEESPSGSILIPQVNVDFTIVASLKDILDGDEQGEYSSIIFDDGTFVDLSFSEPIIHVKEFNSFYEKDNFEIEAFIIKEDGTMHRIEMSLQQINSLEGLILEDDSKLEMRSSLFEPFDFQPSENQIEFYFDIIKDEDIPEEKLCSVVKKLEINSHFLDEELICPDQRTERFNIYATDVSPEDLEDC